MEEKDVQRLLDMLYSMIDEAKSAAFSSDKCCLLYTSQRIPGLHSGPIGKAAQGQILHHPI